MIGSITILYPLSEAGANQRATFRTKYFSHCPIVQPDAIERRFLRVHTLPAGTELFRAEQRSAAILESRTS